MFTCVHSISAGVKNTMVLLTFCDEGDNTQDALDLVTYLNTMTKWIPKNSSQVAYYFFSFYLFIFSSYSGPYLLHLPVFERFLSSFSGSYGRQSFKFFVSCLFLNFRNIYCYYKYDIIFCIHVVNLRILALSRTSFQLIAFIVLYQLGYLLVLFLELMFPVIVCIFCYLSLKLNNYER